MDLLPIHLSVKRGQGRSHDDSAVAANAGFEEVRLRVFERDRHTCRYCGFKAPKWQDINHQDGDHANQAESNLFTACGLCHASHHIGLAGSFGGQLIYLPELSQADLNHLIRTMYMAVMSDNSPHKEAVSHLSAALESRAEIFLRTFGSITTSQMADILLRLSDEEYAIAQESLQDIRLFVHPNQFKQQMAYWYAECYHQLPVNTWENIAAELLP